MKWGKNKNNIDVLGQDRRVVVIGELKLSGSKSDWQDGFGKILNHIDQMEEDKDNRTPLPIYILGGEEPNDIIRRRAKKYGITLAAWDGKGLWLYNRVNYKRLKAILKSKILGVK